MVIGSSLKSLLEWNYCLRLGNAFRDPPVGCNLQQFSKTILWKIKLR